MSAGAGNLPVNLRTQKIKRFERMVEPDKTFHAATWLLMASIWTMHTVASADAGNCLFLGCANRLELVKGVTCMLSWSKHVSSLQRVWIDVPHALWSSEDAKQVSNALKGSWALNIVSNQYNNSDTVGTVLCSRILFIATQVDNPHAHQWWSHNPFTNIATQKQNMASN